MMSNYVSVVVTLAFAVAFQSLSPPWASTKPISTPELFGEGAISSPDDDMDGSFSPDGRTFYFTKNHFGQRLGVIVESHFNNGRWSEPDVVSFSGRFTDYDPFVSADGASIYYTSNRPLKGNDKKDFDLWVVHRTSLGWGEPQNLGPTVNSARDEFYPSIAADGTLYFSATRSDSRGGSDIYRARFTAGAYAEPENLGDAINTRATEVDSVVSADQRVIIFAGFGRPDDMGNGDLYISTQDNGVWSPARHLGAGINSTAREYCPALSPDGKYFFFTSFRGFGDRVPDRAWSYRDLRAGLGSVLNGFGNIYRIDTSALLR